MKETPAVGSHPLPDEEGAEATQRIFFALWPTPESAAEVMAWARSAHALCGGRIMRPETLHLTLAFLGSTPESRVRQLAQAAHRWQVEVGEITLRRFGRFPGPRIVWAGPTLDDTERLEWLDVLHERLWRQLEELGWLRSSMIFRPHVSLLRKADMCDLDSLQRPPLSWKPAACVLVASRPTVAGSRYEVLASMPMVGGRREWGL
jgi:2'-5' RNA ligase